MKDDVRERVLQVPSGRTVADHPFGSRKIEAQELTDVLLDGNATRIEKYRSSMSFALPRRGCEQCRVDTARPVGEVPEATTFQPPVDLTGGHHQRGRGPVEMPHPTIGHRHGKAASGVHVFRELGVVGGRECSPSPKAIAPRGKADGSLRCDMDRVRLEPLDRLPDVATRRDRQADFRIGRAGKRRNILRSNHANEVALPLELADGIAQRRDDAIDLRRPGICRDYDAHPLSLLPPSIAPPYDRDATGV